MEKEEKMDPYGNELEQIATSFNDTVVRFSEMLKENKQLQWESETDHLTQLPNSRAFEQALEAYHQRHPEAKRALVVLDLDHFKGINDTYGHEAGNEILKQFAELLKREDTAKGTIARYGGEEYIILLPSYTKEKALVYADSLRQAIEKEPFMCHNYLHAEAEEVWLTLTASIGVAVYPNKEETEVGELISQADRAMYVGAKRNGRNKVALYRQDMEKE